MYGIISAKKLRYRLKNSKKYIIVSKNMIDNKPLIQNYDIRETKGMQNLQHTTLGSKGGVGVKPTLHHLVNRFS